MTTLVAAFGGAFASPALASLETITPGFDWRDTAGNHLDAQSANVFTAGGTYYMIGEDMSGYNAAANSYPFRRFTCYSSTNLKDWRSHGAALSAADAREFSSAFMGRPHVIYNASTSTYVLYSTYFPGGSYTQGYNMVATSSQPCGPYRFVKLYRPLGYHTGDISLFRDDDGTAYEIFADYTNFGAGLANVNVRIVRLDADYLGASTEVASWRGICREASEMIKRAGTYYLLASSCTGWGSNANLYRTATSMSGPWSAEREVAPPGTNTFDSQNGGIIAVRGPTTTSYVYTGDRFVQDASIGRSAHIWLPLQFTGDGGMNLKWYDSWQVDTATGRVSGNPRTPLDDYAAGTGRNQFEYVGRWSGYASCYSCYQETEHYSDTANDYYQVRFRGTGVHLRGQTSPIGGKAAVSVDGGPETIVDFYSAAATPNVGLFDVTGLAEGDHVLKVRVTGTRHASSGGTFVGADMVTVDEERTVNDGDVGTRANQFDYSAGWVGTGGNAGAFNFDEHYSNTTNASWTVRFDGTQASASLGTGPLAGKVAFRVDGGPETIVDLYSPTREDNFLAYVSPLLAPGAHTLTARVTGTKNPLASNAFGGADRVWIRP